MKAVLSTEKNQGSIGFVNSSRSIDYVTDPTLPFERALFDYIEWEDQKLLGSICRYLNKERRGLIKYLKHIPVPASKYALSRHYKLTAVDFEALMRAAVQDWNCVPASDRTRREEWMGTWDYLFTRCVNSVVDYNDGLTLWNVVDWIDFTLGTVEATMRDLKRDTKEHRTR